MNNYTLTTTEHDAWYSDDARISDAMRADIRSRGYDTVYDQDGIVIM